MRKSLTVGMEPPCSFGAGRRAHPARACCSSLAKPRLTSRECARCRCALLRRLLPCPTSLRYRVTATNLPRCPGRARRCARPRKAVAQLFPRWFGFVFRLGALAAVVIVIAVLLLWRVATAEPTTPHDPLEQPVPFSHKHHVGDDGIDCRYCHSSVEQSAFAGIPPTKTCMNCHSQIWADSPTLEPVRESFRSGQSIQWTRVHNLPGFVYFDHSIHIHKGVGCSTCHGQIDKMPLTWRENTLYM